MTSLTKYKLKVFISSAMRGENETKWMSIRKSIKHKLAKCEYLQTFTIEDHASEFPSTQLFTWHITQSDIVVILIKNEIRPGTNQEIEKALEEDKPTLIYFYNPESPSSSVQEFKNYLMDRDKVTFKLIDDDDEIDKIVLNDVINNVINYYQLSHDSPQLEEKDNYFSTEILFEDSILDKRFLDYFGNNQDNLIDNLNLSIYARTDVKKSEENKLGTKLLTWLYNGSFDVREQELITILEKLSLSDDIIEVLKLRHQSIQKYFNNEVDTALSCLDKAYELARESRMPSWLLGDILIDCRNIYSKHNLINNKYQQKIRELDSFIYFPVGDRFLKRAFETLEKERLTIRTLSPTATRFGNTLLGSLQDIENYLYTSFMIGSSTHLLLARKKMFEILIEYGEIYKDRNLIYQALKLIIIAGEVKNFSKTLAKYWHEVNDILAANVNELWDLTDAEHSINKNNMKCSIIKSLGQYMHNSLFRKAMTFLLQYAQELEHHAKVTYLLDAINYNLQRFNNEFVLDMLLDILKSDKIMDYSKVSKLLSEVNLTKCDELDIKELSNVLKEKLNNILNNNGSPYFIINLLKQQSSNFNDLYDLIRNEVPEDQLDFIDIRLEDSKKEEKILMDSIIKLEKRFNPYSSIHISYANDPLAVIIVIIKNYKTENLITLLNEQFIPLVIKVLSSDTSLEEKDSYLGALVTLLVEYKKENKNIPEKLKSLFADQEIVLEGSTIFSNASVISAKYYINTINSLLGIDAENNIFSTCVDYKEKSSTDRDAFSYSIQKYIEFNLISNNKIPLFIDLVVLEMLRDDYFSVRKNALKCLMLLYNNSPSYLLKAELVRMTMDSSPNVKGYFLSLLGDNLLRQDVANELLTLFSKDASFNIRESSQEKLIKMTKS